MSPYIPQSPRLRRMNKVLRWSCALALPVTILLALLGGVCR